MDTLKDKIKWDVILHPIYFIKCEMKEDKRHTAFALFFDMLQIIVGNGFIHSDEIEDFPLNLYSNYSLFI